MSFYEDTGTTAKLFWDASAESLGIGTSSPAGKTHSVAADSQVAVMAGGDVSDPLYPAFGFDGQIGSNGGRGAGMYLPSDGTLAWSTAGSERMRIDASGNVGIGTSSLTGGNTILNLSRTGSGAGCNMQFSNSHNGAFYVGLSGDTAGDAILHSADGTAGMAFGTGNTERMRIDSSGNVGIGTSSPTAKLTVSGTGVGAAIDWTNTTASTGRSYRWVSLNNGTGFAIEDLTAGSERMRVDASGNVGIGTSSPQDEIHIEANYPQIRIASGLNTIGSNNLTSTVDGYGTDGIAWRVGRAFGSGDLQIVNHRASATTFDNGGAERMRIDSSGNLLVGTTDTSLYNNGAGGDTGLVFEPSGTIQFAKSNNICAHLNRLDSDGQIINFRKNGTLVGSIAASGGDILIGTGDTAVRFVDAEDSIVPFNTNGSGRDNAINLGKSSERFKDLYLSGGVYLGGTGAANKLDDYEEGLFTPTVAGSSTTGSATYATQYGSYTKIGNTVYFHAVVNYSGATGTGSLRVTGLPFNTASGIARVFTVGLANISYSGDFVYGYSVAGTNQVGLAAVNNGAGTSTLYVDAAGLIEITGTYQAA